MIDNSEEHFIMDEPDPAKSKAVESGLWEIKTLQNQKRKLAHMGFIGNK